MNRSTPGLPVHHQLPEPTQTHVHRVGDAIQQSHPLLSPSLPAFNLSQHQCLSNESVFHISSVQFSRSVVSNSLWSHEPQHTRPPCPSPTLRVHPNLCPLCWWYHSTISFSVVPFPSCPQSFPVSGSFRMSQLFESGGQIIGASSSVSVLPMNIQDWFPLGLTGLISLQSKRLSRVFSNTTVEKHKLSKTLLFYLTLFNITINITYLIKFIWRLK